MTDIGKFTFVYRTIGDWNQFPAQVLETPPYKSTTLKKKAKECDNYMASRSPKLAKSIG
jgi:hypothetical protein